MKIAIIGYGGMGKWHGKYLLNSDVLELAGIKNIRAKSLRSNNKTNVVKATFEGLKQLRSVEEVAKTRGIAAEKVLG